MSNANDLRLIEDYLPIEAIGAEASREKSVRKGHISTLHLWWARRPLVACRAAVYGALVPAARFVPNGASDEKKKSLGRANAAKFVKRLCRYPSDSKPEEKADIERAVQDAQQHILDAHAQRLTGELAEAATKGSPSRLGRRVQVYRRSRDCRRHHCGPRPAAAGAGHVCGRRGDSAGSLAVRLRSLRAST